MNQIRFCSDPTCSAMIPCANSDQIYLDPWTGRARSLNRHHTLGAYAAVFVLPSALTGVPHAGDWHEHGVYRIAGSPLPAPPAAAPAGPGTRRLLLEQLWRRAHAELPGVWSYLHRRTGRAPEIQAYDLAHDGE